MFRLTSCLAVLVMLVGAGEVWAVAIMPGVIGHWKFDEPPGSVLAADASGNGNTGAVVGADFNPWTGQIGGMLNLDGNGDYVDLPVLSNNTPSQMTVSFWVSLPDEPDALDSIWHRDRWDTIGSLHILFAGSARRPMNFGVLGLPFEGFRAQTRNNLLPEGHNRWIHIATTYDSLTGEMVHYRNGLPDGDAVVAAAIPPLDLGPATIAAWDNDGDGIPDERFLNGRLDDLVFFDGVLNGDQIDTIYSRGLEGIDAVTALIPEPSTLVLLGMGAVGLLLYAWRRRRS